MLDSFRRLSKSRIGIAVFAIFIGALAFGFAAADIRGLSSGGRISAGSDTVAEVGKAKITYAELVQRAQRALDNARQERPTLTMAEFVRAGGIDQLVQQMTDTLALEQFAKSQGFGVSRRMEDAQIASAAAFKGLNGKFDQSAFEQFLSRQRISEREVRDDLAREMYLTQMLVPATGTTPAPETLTLPYASMLLEQRSGRAQFVPATAFKGAPPTDADLEAYYRKNIARYTTPERRVVRYALIDRAAFEAAAQPSDAEIAAAYNANKADYAAKETRTISQVILPSEAAARELAAKVSAGAPIADAARAAGLESVTLNDQTRETYEQASSAAVANAVFATPQGKVAAPAKSGLGWHVARVDKVATLAGKSLDQVRGELLPKLKKDKADQAMAEGIARIEDAIGDGSTFDEVVQANKLQAVKTPALFADGRNPEAPGAAVAPALPAVMKTAFGMDVGDDPLTEPVVPNQTIAIVKTDSIVPPTPQPLAQIRDKVAADLVAERSLAAARQAADAIAAKVASGAPLPQAAAGAGAPLPAPVALSGRRGELLREGAQLEPQQIALFTLGRGKARVVPAKDRSGWYVVVLDGAVPGDARSQPQLLQATRVQFSPVFGQEYGQQLAAAARKQVGVEINPAAVARLKSELIGGAPAR